MSDEKTASVAAPRLNCSAEIDKLAAALAKAQGKMGHASKDSANPHFKSRYADLASVTDACRGPLSENGLAVVQRPFSDSEGVGVETLLLHTSGQWISTELHIPLAVSARTAHAVGSAITYARRFTLQAMTGIAPAEDDDGNAAADAQRSAPRDESPRETATQRAKRELVEKQAKSSNGGESAYARLVKLGAVYGLIEAEVRTRARAVTGKALTANTITFDDVEATRVVLEAEKARVPPQQEEAPF